MLVKPKYKKMVAKGNLTSSTEFNNSNNNRYHLLSETGNSREMESLKRKSRKDNPREIQQKQTSGAVNISAAQSVARKNYTYQPKPALNTQPSTSIAKASTKQVNPRSKVTNQSNQAKGKGVMTQIPNTNPFTFNSCSKGSLVFNPSIPIITPLPPLPIPILKPNKKPPDQPHGTANDTHSNLQPSLVFTASGGRGDTPDENSMEYQSNPISTVNRRELEIGAGAPQCSDGCNNGIDGVVTERETHHGLA